MRPGRRALAPGLEPKEVADLFYASLRERDADTFLATLAQPLKDTPGVGAFAAKECGWDAGVAKVRKYDCQWFFSPHGGKQFKSHLGEGGRVFETCDLRYEATYGNVPGYTTGAAMGSADEAVSGRGPLGGSAHGTGLVSITLIKSVEDGGEWRVCTA